MLTNVIDQSGGVRLRTRKIEFHFSGGIPKVAQRSTLTELIATIGTILGAGFGVKFLSSLRAKKNSAKNETENTNELTMKIFDEGDSFRAVLIEEARESRRELDVIRERAHQAEMRATLAESKIVVLEAQLEAAKARVCYNAPNCAGRDSDV